MPYTKICYKDGETYRVYSWWGDTLNCKKLNPNTMRPKMNAPFIQLKKSEVTMKIPVFNNRMGLRAKNQ